MVEATCQRLITKVTFCWFGPSVVVFNLLPTVLHSCNSEYSVFYSTIIRFITNRQASVTFVTPVPGRHRFQVAQIALRCLANT